MGQTSSKQKKAKSNQAPCSYKPPASTYEALMTEELYRQVDLTSDPSITAASIPQWTWDNKECRDWLTAVFIQRGIDVKTAKKLATKAMPPGLFGPSLYLRDVKDWRKVLDAECSLTVFSLLSRAYEEVNIHFPITVLFVGDYYELWR